MADMLYLRLDGIDGEEPIGDNSKKAIKVNSYSHQLNMQISPMRPSAGEDMMNRCSYCKHGLFNIHKSLDRTSPKLFEACSAGVNFESAVVYACASVFKPVLEKSEPEPFFSIVMKDVVIVDFQYEFVNDWQMEVLRLQYRSIGWKLDWINPDDGKNERVEPSGWDGKLNKAAAVAIPDGVKWPTALL